MVIGTPTVLNLIPGGVMKIIHVNQVNENIEIQFRIMNGAQPFNVPEGVSCTIRGTKGDNFGYAAAVAVTAGSNVVTVTLTEQLTAVAGTGNVFELVFVGSADDMKVSTENFKLAVERAALGEDTVISDSDLAYADQVLDQLQSVGAVNAQVQQNKANIAAEITRATAADNTLQSNINVEASTRAATDQNLQAQISQIVAPSGEAPSAAEVQNARVGADGVTYQTLGDAIRTNDSNLKSQISVSETFANSGAYTFDGSMFEQGGWAYTSKAVNAKRIRLANMIPVKKGMQIHYTNPTLDVAFNISKTESSGSAGFITSGWMNKGAVNALYTIPQDGYLAVMCRKDDVADTTVTDYDCTISITSVDRIDIDKCLNQLVRYNAYDVLSNYKKTTGTSHGITYTWNGDVCTVNGTSTNYSANIIYNGTLPEEIVPGSKYDVRYSTTDTNAVLRIIFSKADDTVIETMYFPSGRTIEVPANAAKWNVGLFVTLNKTISNAVVSNVAVLSAKTNKELRDLIESGFVPRGALANGTDFNTINDNGYWFTTSTHTYQNCPLPSGIPGIIISYIYNDSLRAQVVYSVAVNQPNVWIRSCVFGNWFAWKEMKDYGAFSTKSAIPNGTDFDTLTDSGIWMIQASETYVNNPMPNYYGGTLICFKSASTVTLQIAVEGANVAKMYIRMYVAAIGWRPWTTIQGGNTYNNTYVTQNYENTYNITATPTITTDTNNYLASTNDTTDRTGDIQTMLNTTGVCRLGPGVFYTTGVEVPNYGALIGSGKKTQLILAASVTNGYAVKLKTYSTVRDICILGATSAITPSSTVGTRHGILFEGTADAQSNPQTFYRSYVTGCLIRNFAGGGITCYNTGLSPAASLVVSDCQIAVCDAGINIPYFSEFHRITNVTAQECYYGCIDNGGNNNFANCDFSGNKMALLIDNSTNQSRNNTHGTFSACTFHHSDNTYNGGSIVSVGTAIRILGAIAGEIFTGCQIGYGDIEIDDSVGIRFDACNFLRMTALQITDSPLVVFSDCNFWDANSSPLTQSGNTTLKFSDCYLMNGTAFNPMA